MRLATLVRQFTSTFLGPRPPRTERTEPLSRAEILRLLEGLPVSEWRYDWDPDSLHIGPMAQDWRAAFGYGRRETTIDVVDCGHGRCAVAHRAAAQRSGATGHPRRRAAPAWRE
ncbi:tail fiber domain-containing protein [Streptomyces sp. NPDC001665]